MSNLFPNIKSEPDYPPGVSLVDIGVEEEDLEEAVEEEFDNQE